MYRSLSGLRTTRKRADAILVNRQDEHAVEPIADPNEERRFAVDLREQNDASA